MRSEEFRLFRYPDIQVEILDTLVEGKETLKYMKLDLKRYFNVFLKEDLHGLMFEELVDIIEKYI